MSPRSGRVRMVRVTRWDQQLLLWILTDDISHAHTVAPIYVVLLYDVETCVLVPPLWQPSLDVMPGMARVGFPYAARPTRWSWTAWLLFANLLPNRECPVPKSPVI